MAQFKAVFQAGVLTFTTLAIAPPVAAQPVPQASLNACLTRTAEAMVVPARDLQLVSAGPVDAGKGTRTLFMRNTVTGQTAECKVNTIDAFVLDVRLTSQPPRPPQGGIPQASINACTTRAAEELVVAAREITFVSAGPINAQTGVADLTMRHQLTGRTVTCRVNTITNTVLSVQATPAPRPPQGVPQASIDACIQQTAEAMVVAARDIELLNAGAVGANGVATLNMRNRATGQTATCQVNTNTNRVLTVQLGGPTPPPNQGRPVAPTDPMARNCQAAVGNKVRRSFGGVKQINFLSDTTRAYFISNAQEGIRGIGQFRQSSPNWTDFNYNCTVNRRNGVVERATFNVIR